jgi:hypothetical protein
MAVLPVHGVDAGRCTCGEAQCDRLGKHPCAPQGVKEASSDPATIAGWWRQWPAANVAIATGAVSGVWVADVDGDQGMASMRRLELEHSESLPKTVTARTGGGGLHLVWRLETGVAVPSRVRVRAVVDVRGDGGYIVAPPSLHASGRRYEWLEGRGPHQLELAEAPGWLLDVVLGRGDGHHTERHDWPTLFRERIAEGSRNDAIARRAGYLLRRGLESDVAAVLLEAWSQAHCRPPLSDREVRRTVASIARREQRKGRR